MKPIHPVVAFNKERWEELSGSNVKYAVPKFDLDQQSAKQMIDPEDQIDNFKGIKALCLSAGGGQQSAAFGILGAQVTVFDLSENQLEKDRQTAAHYNINVKTLQGDMQDLSIFKTESFDIVWLAHSINFVPDAKLTISEIARVCKVKGKVRLNFTNPYVHGVWAFPVGEGFLLSQPYIDGDQVKYPDPHWTFIDPEGNQKKIEGPV